MISRVFVVDDERLIASTTTAILELNGYEAHSLVNPLEALEAVRTVGPPDLVIADVIMQGLSGIDLAVRLKEECPSCKVLLLSGHTETESLLQAARRQGHDFEILAKPIPPAHLLARIKDEDGAAWRALRARQARGRAWRRTRPQEEPKQRERLPRIQRREHSTRHDFL
jgi:DNA-binding NtrC family response regulator